MWEGLNIDLVITESRTLRTIDPGVVITACGRSVTACLCCDLRHWGEEGLNNHPPLRLGGIHWRCIGPVTNVGKFLRYKTACMVGTQVIILLTSGITAVIQLSNWAMRSDVS